MLIRKSAHVCADFRNNVFNRSEVDPGNPVEPLDLCRIQKRAQAFLNPLTEGQDFLIQEVQMARRLLSMKTW